MEVVLRVNPIACDGYGHCVELAPELIALDDWGYPILDTRPVPASLRQVADEAVRRCPRRALFLEETATKRT